MRDVKQPKIETAKGVTHDSKVTHPAFGMVGASRVSGAFNLFGSHIEQDGAVRITIKEAAQYRNGLAEYTHAGNIVAEVYLSEAQWVGFVSRMNIGDGVPCTLSFYRDGNGYQPPGLPPQEKIADRLGSRAEIAGKELDDHVTFVHAELMAMIDTLPVRKAKDMRAVLDRLVGHLNSNAKFYGEQLVEAKEKLVQESITEISNAIDSRIMALGLNSLQQLASINAPVASGFIIDEEKLNQQQENAS